MSDNHKATSKHFLEMWGDNTLHLSTDYLSPNYVNHQCPDVSGGTRDRSLEEWNALVKEFHEAFSDAKMEILLQVAEGDCVASRWRNTATQTGTFLGREPTGKVTTWTGVQTDRYEGGKIVESWVDWDMVSFLAGLGMD